MQDVRVALLACNLLTHSVKLQPGEIIYIEKHGDYSHHLLRELIRQATAMGAVPFWFDYDESLQRDLLMETTEAQVIAHGQLHLKIMELATAFISIRGSNNPFDLSDVPPEHMAWHTKHFQGPVHIERRAKHTKWVVIRYPNNTLAALAKMSQKGFEDFYFEVCTMDYARMSMAMDPLVALMQRTDRVRLVAPGTELSFSIANIPVVKCAGEYNIPDGEVYTAPVRDSISGQISFNAPSLYKGQMFSDVTLEFRDGKIVEATAGVVTSAFNKIIDIDDGGRFMGEFALGVNPHITRPMLDTLFDEKIGGSVHMAIGNSYDSAPNGNSSAIHWDLVLMMMPEHGGGEVWFDGVLVRKDGLFVLDRLKGLNPEALMSKN